MDSLNAGFWAHDTQSKATPKHNIQPNRKIPFFTELQNYNNPSGNFAVNLSDCPMNPDTNIANNIAKIKEQLPQHCRLIVVSKYRSLEEIQGAYNAHHRDFAENRVQPLLERAEALPSDIQWHLIGHLQTNKVKFIAPFIAMIHSVDSIKLLQEINKEAEKNHRVIPCLIQLHVAQEETKFGIEPEQAMDFFNEIATLSLKNIKIHGLMAMASFTEDQQQIASEFQQVQETFNKIKQIHFPNDSRFSELSIGMSSDYPIAIENGSTMIRIGSAVFA